MTIVFEKYTAAQCAADANLAEGKDWQKSNVPRRVKRVMMSGSAALWDTRVDLYYGSEKVMELRNTSTGGPLKPLDSAFWHPSKLVLMAGVPLNMIVVDAAATNPVYLYLDIAELV